MLGLLRRIEVGQIVVSDSDGALFVCGNARGEETGPTTELNISRETFWVRALLFADMVRAVGLTLDVESLLGPGEIKRLRRSGRLGLCRELHARRNCLFRPRGILSGLPPDDASIACWHRLTGVDLHPEPCQSLQCNDLDLVLCFYPDQPCPQYQYAGQLPIERLCSL